MFQMKVAEQNGTVFDEPCLSAAGKVKKKKKKKARKSKKVLVFYYVGVNRISLLLMSEKNCWSF